jgi:hypothetical protein
VGEHLVPKVPGLIAPFCVNRHDDTLATESVRGIADEAGAFDRCGIHRHLVGAGQEQIAHVGHAARAAAHRQRDEDLLGRARHDVEERPPGLHRRRDVQVDEFVGAVAIIECRECHRVAGVAQVDERLTLHDAAVAHVQARNDPLGQHQRVTASARTASRSARRPS